MAVAIPDTGFSRAVYVLWGILMIVAGLFLLTHPTTTALVLVEIMAIFWIVGGIFDLIRAISGRPPYWGWVIAASIIGIIAGLYILANPVLGTIFTVTIAFIMLAVYGIVAGVLNVIAGFRAEGGTRWSAVILGFILIVLAGWLLFNWQYAIISFLPVVAVFMIVGGIFTIIASFYVGSAGVPDAATAPAPAPTSTAAAPAPAQASTADAPAPTTAAPEATPETSDDTPPAEPAG
jgi:uncharacterized membrane protein HdeD (DUF308 family)